MAFLSPGAARSVRRTTMTLAALSAGALAACSDKAPPTSAEKPVLPGNSGPANPYRGSAFVFDVDTRSGKVVVTSPQQAGITNGPTSSLAPSLSKSPGNGPSYSIVAGDVIEITASNYRICGLTSGACAANLPAPPAGMQLVQIDVQITNRLGGVELITPTFPTPPAGAAGPLLFPFEFATVSSPGGVSVGGDGTEVIVTQPSTGAVRPSPSWNGATERGGITTGDDFNFFNDIGCSATANDCYRYEEFPTIPAGATTAVQTVGFFIDPTVGRFRSRFLAAADLRSATLQTGTIAGSVGGAPTGVSVTGIQVSAGGTFIGTTNAAGAYSIANVNVGPRTVSLVAATLPAGCTAAPQSITVSPSTTTTVNFTLAGCTVPSGTVAGTILQQVGTGTPTGIQNVSVTITPTGGSALAAVTTTASGAFSRSGVPSTPGSGTFALGNVPGNCTVPASALPPNNTFSGVTTGGTVTIPTITLSCTQPPPNTLSGTWVTQGSSPVYELAITLPTDQLSGITFDVTYNNTLLALNPVPPAITSISSCASAVFDLFTRNTNVAPNRVRVALTSTAGLTATGTQCLVRIAFNRLTAGAASMTTTISQASGPAPLLENLIPRIAIVDATLP